ncbi:MAG: hypothetical protein K2W82_19320 [Candidatus Obscuribacterales bacterium]|nr:hypothetical protein [Candidatus Obscuribacterales bacterium]
MTVSKEQLALWIVSMAYPSQLSPVQLQKAVFLAQKALEEGGWEHLLTSKYEFEPYDYGPFCKEIYSDLTGFEAQGLVQVGVRFGRSAYNTYATTDEGKHQIDEQTASIPSAVKDHFSDLVKWVKQQSFASLVGAIYRKYPDMKVNSVFKG